MNRPEHSRSEDPEPDSPATRARDRHAAVRLANQTETAEDYVEAIESLVAETGEARVRDLAACFGVSHVTVSRTVDRLQRRGLVTTEPYRSIELTDAGRSMARASRARHATVLRFLIALGVPQAAAEEDAEGVEHHVGPETLAAFQRFADQQDEPQVLPPPPSNPDPDRFARVRQAHAIELTEDYVEAIGDLIADRGKARVGDLARRFGVSHVTASRMLGRLQKAGLVMTEPYRPVVLTPEGEALANASRARHGVVLDFFLSLGIEPQAAEIDAEGVEHHVSEASLDLFRAHIERRESDGPART